MSQPPPSGALRAWDWVVSLALNASLALCLLGVQLVRPGAEEPLPQTEPVATEEADERDVNADQQPASSPADSQSTATQPADDPSPAAGSEFSKDPPSFTEAVDASSWNRLMGEMVPSAAGAEFREELAGLWDDASEGREATPEAQMEALEEVADALRKEITAQFRDEAAAAATKTVATESWKHYAPAVRGTAATEIQQAFEDPSLGDAARVGQLARVVSNLLPDQATEVARTAWSEHAAPEVAATTAALLARAMAAQGVTVGPEAFVEATREAASQFAEKARFSLADALRPVAEATKAPGAGKKLDAEGTAQASAIVERMLENVRTEAGEAAKASTTNVAANFRPPVSKGLAAKFSTLRRIETRIAAMESGRGRDGSLAGSLALLAGGGTSPGDATFENAAAQMAEAGADIAFDRARHAELLARLEGRPGSGAPTLGRVAGEGTKTGRRSDHPAVGRLFALPMATSEVEAPGAAEPGLVVPDFPHAAFTVASYAETEPVIDGDLSDWDMAQPGATTATRSDGVPPESPATVRFRWSPRGLYFAYALEDAGGLHVSSGAPYHGDCFELYLDTANSRVANRSDSDTAHQYFFMPFGYRGEASDTFQRAGGNAPAPRGLSDQELNTRRDISFARARQTAEGYHVEGFLARSAVTEPFLPGSMLGLEFSISRDWNFPSQMQWHTPKSVNVWKHPNLWGDLLLLGTDAEISFPLESGAELERTAAAPGEDVLVRIDDRDMNLDPDLMDSVAVRVDLPGVAGRVVFLEETGPNTGIFEGPVPLPASTRGELQLTYIDAVTGKGARNETLRKSLRLGWPLMQIATLETKP